MKLGNVIALNCECRFFTKELVRLWHAVPSGHSGCPSNKDQFDSFQHDISRKCHFPIWRLERVPSLRDLTAAGFLRGSAKIERVYL
jgi:hypothetical protein